MTRQTSRGAKVSSELNVKAVKISSELTAAESVGDKRSVTTTGKQTAWRVVSRAIRREAVWQMLRTADYVPIGGLDFSATVLITDAAHEVEVGLTATVEFEDWGSVRSELPPTFLELPKPNKPARTVGALPG